MNSYNPKPRGRPPRCYKLAYKYAGCLECAWYRFCKPREVPVQVSFEAAPLKPEEVP